MNAAIWISLIVLWILFLGLAAIVFALSRQIGLLHERIAPVGALDLGKGTRVGERAPEFRLFALEGEAVDVGGSRSNGRSLLLFFLSPTCPVCDQLIPIVRSLRDSESDWLDVVLASDGDFETHREFVRKKSLEDFNYVVSTELGMGFQVGRLPHAVLMDADGVVRGQGLVNTREHLESLIEAMERDVASVQEFMRGPGSDDEHLNVA